MVNKIYWTDTAKASMKIIFDYYKKHVSISIANKIKDEIFNDIKILKNHELIGAKEPLLDDLDNGYRYLVSGNYKLIYFIKDKVLIISLVFDTRQSPSILKKIIKRVSRD